MKTVIEKLQAKQNLTPAEIEGVMQTIMSGQAEQADIAAFLMALREKGPTVDEITGAARIMREFVIPIKTTHPVVLDTCGTGGDRKGTFNISTLTALVVAGAGVVVAKHGNRSVSSTCGSADILEALGVRLQMEEAHLERCLDEVGLAFLFAQKLHPAMKNVAAVRKELGVETIFNILGPLTNPARATHQMVGVYSRDFVEPLARVLSNLGLKRGLVVHGADGLDEITTTARTFISEFKDGEIRSYDVGPEELGVERADLQDLQAGDRDDCLRIFEEVLAGKDGPHKDIVLLNAAYALYAAEKTDRIDAGLRLARDVLESGKARAKLDQLVAFTQRANPSE